MIRPIFSLAATLALVGGTHASVIVDNFESYSPYSDMHNQGGWTVSGPISVDGPVAIADPDFTWPGSGLQAATVGDDAITTTGINSLYHSANVPFVSVTPTPTSFKFETAYTESTNGFRNNFQFVLSATSGVSSNLLTINLTPTVTPGEYSVAWTSGFFAAGSIAGPLNAGFITQFQLDTWWDRSAVAYNFSNGGVSLSNGTLGLALATDVINQFAVNWDSTTGGGVGNNSITIDNVSLVPEPSSALLGLLGASFAFARRRRA